jgi:hypothetical protein
MKNIKQQAIALRLKGMSYLEIQKLLGTPKSTLSSWLRNVQISDTALMRINKKGRQLAIEALIKRNQAQTHKAIQRSTTIQKTSSKEIGLITHRELLLLGASLYWAEGYKRPIVNNGKTRTYHPVSLSNSDPLLIKLFLKFLREVCKVEDSKISANIRIFEHQNASQLLQFWHKTTKIPLGKFHKFYYGISKSSLGKRPFNVLPYGTIQIVIGDTQLFHRIMGWIKGLSII